MTREETKRLVALYKSRIGSLHPHLVVFTENFKKLLPVLEAFAAGKTIEHNISPASKNWWTTSEDFSFDSHPDNYRVKPELPVVEIDGKKYQVDLDKAVKNGYIKPVE